MRTYDQKGQMEDKSWRAHVTQRYLRFLQMSFFLFHLFSKKQNWTWHKQDIISAHFLLEITIDSEISKKAKKK